MQPIDQSVRFIEFVAQAGHPPSSDQRSMTLNTARPTFGGFHLLGDFIDVRVQRLQ